MRCRWLWLMVLLVVRPAYAFDPDISGQDPVAIVRVVADAVETGAIEALAPWFTAKGQAALVALVVQERQDGTLKRLGAVRSTDLDGRDDTADGAQVVVHVRYQYGRATWTLTYLDAPGRIDDIAVEPVEAAPVPTPRMPGPRPASIKKRGHYSARMKKGSGSSPEIVVSAPPPAAEPADPSASPAALPAPLGHDVQPADAQTVDFLFATTRRTVDHGDKVEFTADRGTALQYGTVRVHVPDQNEHQPGRVELPRRISLFGVTLYEGKFDEKKHFVIRYGKLLSAKDFFDTLASRSDKEALVFVHGFKTTFEASVYRFAQILFDLQYKKPAILFSWASKGEIADYGYDKESALIARDDFTTLLRDLRSKGFTKVNVVAHSMGNLVVIDALANAADTADPARVAQLIMAAPDVDRDYFRQNEPKLAKIADGLTLYACATDRALMLSKEVAGGIPRAGDVPAEGPITMPGLDTIDVSALGQDWFGINHDLFASNRSVLQDIVALLALGKHPPRLDMVHGMPLGTTPPAFWRFQP